MGCYIYIYNLLLHTWFRSQAYTTTYLYDLDNLSPSVYHHNCQFLFLFFYYIDRRVQSSPLRHTLEARIQSRFRGQIPPFFFSFWMPKFEGKVSSFKRWLREGRLSLIRSNKTKFRVLCTSILILLNPPPPPSPKKKVFLVVCTLLRLREAIKTYTIYLWLLTAAWQGIYFGTMPNLVARSPGPRVQVPIQHCAGCL